MGFIFNGNTKTINLSIGTTQISVRDLWSRWVDWWLTVDNSKYLKAMDFVGGNDIDVNSGTIIPIYLFLQNGWRIKPQESNHTLNVNDGILLVEGGGDPFINTNGSFIVRINYQQPVQAISFNTGSGGGNSLTAVEVREEMDNNSIKLQHLENMLLELWKINGMDSNLQMIVNKNGRTVGDIVQTFQTSGTSVIVTRNT